MSREASTSISDLRVILGFVTTATYYATDARLYKASISKIFEDGWGEGYVSLGKKA